MNTAPASMLLLVSLLGLWVVIGFLGLIRPTKLRLVAHILFPLGAAVGVAIAGKRRAQFDAGRAAQNMLLAAWNEGVSSCPNGVADADAAHAALGLAEDETLVIVLTFGIPERPRVPGSRTPEEWSDRANRRPLDDVVRRVR